MATTYGTQFTNIVNNALGQLQTLNDIQLGGGKVRVYIENIVYASQASGSLICCARVPLNAVILAFVLITDTSTGSATLAIQDFAASPNTYVAASAYTSTNTPTIIGKPQAPATGYGVGQEITTAYDYNGTSGRNADFAILTATASLPASGNLTLYTLYVDGAS